ncbi:MAG: TonB-dependent receptor, partial [Bacteroidales bacterium]|nr:TonB-dependent receptor [Bacteroidales bacterium]
LGIQAEDKSTVSGYIKDAQTGEVLISATVYVAELETGLVSNQYGFFSITLPDGKYNLRFSYVGYEPQVVSIEFSGHQQLNIELEPLVEDIQTVTITARGADHNVKSTEISMIKLNMKELSNLPVLFGEKDILKSIQLLPGVKPAGEGSTGFFVRGGNADQNLILLDEAPVYNASHLMGFFSVFNSDVIKDAQLYKGGMPSEYGGRLSSVLDVTMNDGNSKRFGVSGGIGLISSRLTLEGPIKKDVGSFIISGRRTYADAFLKFFPDTTINKTRLYFYDFNLKANYRLGKKDRVYLSGYFGRDVLGFQDIMGIDWGNTTGTLRWNHLFGDRLFLNSSVVFSDYNFNQEAHINDFTLKILSGIKDFNIKEDFQFYLNSRNSLKWGGNIIYHTFMPGQVESTFEGFEPREIDDRYAWDAAAYISHQSKIGSRIQIDYGIRYSRFIPVGPGDYYSFMPDGSISDTVSYQKGESIADYGGFEPRASLSFLLSDQSSVKASYNRNRQYIHLISNSTSGTPLDSWIPSSNIVKPEIADQIALGYFRNFNNNQWESSIEVYYKTMQNQIEYKNGADLISNPLVESQLVFGEGLSYGLELYVKKKSGKLTGWISYTLSRTIRSFENIDYGAWFPARQDRTHDVSIVAMYQLNRKWSFSATWVYYTGDAVTFPSGKYFIDGSLVSMYTERNGYRMPDYHRLDLGVTFINKKRDRYTSSWNFGIYNAYARENAYSINFIQSEDDPTITQAEQLSLFSIVPSITWNFKF